MKYLQYTVQWQKCIEDFSIHSYSFLALVLAQHVLSNGMLEPRGTLFGLLFWHLTNPEHFREDRKCFLCTFSPGPGKGKTWMSFPCVELVNSLWTPCPAKRSFRLDPNGFTVWGPTTNMTSFLDGTFFFFFLGGFNMRHVSSQSQNQCYLDRWANANTWFKNMHKNILESRS